MKFFLAFSYLAASYTSNGLLIETIPLIFGLSGYLAKYYTPYEDPREKPTKYILAYGYF